MKEAGNNKTEKKPIVLALQGGGAHTAYVWGVIDRLLERDDVEIVGVSGTSGGAMIATVLAYGLSQEHDAQGAPLDDAGRRALTRQLLDTFWAEVAAIGDLYWNPYRFVANPWYRSWNIDGMPVPVMLNTLSLLTSPYQSLGGARQNPVAAAITKTLDLQALRHSTSGPALYVCATNVRTNQPKVFEKHEIDIAHLLASACLPVVDRAVEIEGEFYWDGGYTCDPALAPLIERHRNICCDLVIVGVNPIVIEQASVPPDSAWEIIDRMNEITFNAALIAEVQRIISANELLKQVPLDTPARQPGGKLYGKETVRIHYMPPHADMAKLGVASKSNTSHLFLEHLKSLGREEAMEWESGRVGGDDVLRMGYASHENLNDIFIDPQRWNAPTLPKGALVV
ncbi:MAG TPA: patatin-like phospholipase family protein [Noviherbaspirillum sp.]|nr:patatin-like phospholipase family protein [Noviherbaspirillum sp.]